MAGKFWKRKKKLKTEEQDPISLVKILPSVITLAASMIGLMSVKFAISGYFSKSVLMLNLAAILDGLDGKIARKLNSCSVFGGELDSLADVISFGVCSPLVLYLWGIREVKFLGVCALLFFAACMQIRLARFNTLNIVGGEGALNKPSNYFQGIPAPVAAMLNLIPVIISLEFGIEKSVLVMPAIAWSVGVALFAVSRIPTLSIKNVVITRQNTVYILTLISAIIVGYVVAPLKALLAIISVYLATFPLVIFRYYKPRTNV